MRLPRRALIIAGSAAVLLAAGTAAGAAIAASPIDSSGAIHGCYTTRSLNGSHVFVLEDSGTSCPRGTTAISWNQQGPAGQNGSNGANGQSVASTELASGDPDCASGGASFTSVSGTTYACNGTPGTVGQQGPAGPSTAGAAGLSAEVISATATGSAVVTCPASHPYALSGGAQPGAGDSLTGSWPLANGDDQPVGWQASSSADGQVLVYAVCSQ
jgi:hypothetical protein